jgi:spore coat-associated protein N
MSRLHVLVHRPRRTLAALATVLVAVGVTAASGANFSATSANPSNTFATGTLTMSNSKDNAAIFTTASNMKPGDAPVVGQVDIANTGSLSGAFTLSRSTPVDSDATNKLSGKLNVVVVDCGTFAGSSAPSCDAGDAKIYDGTLAAMGAGTPIAPLGTYAGDAKHRYEFRVAVDSSAGNEYQGDSSQVEFTWNAVQ